MPHPLRRSTGDNLGDKSRRADPAPSQLQYLGEQSLLIVGVTGEPAHRNLGELALPLVSCAVVWMREKYLPFFLAPYQLQQVGGQALWPPNSCNTQESKSVPHLGIVELTLHVGAMGKLPLGFECVSTGAASSLPCSGIGEGNDLLPSFLPWPLTEGRRVGPMGVMKTGELSLSLICCST